MMKDVGIAVPKTRETRVVYMPQDKRLWHIYNNNTRRNTILKRDVGWGYAWYYCCMPVLLCM